jgi:hypothetical protein
MPSAPTTQLPVYSNLLFAGVPSLVAAPVLQGNVSAAPSVAGRITALGLPRFFDLTDNSIAGTVIAAVPAIASGSRWLRTLSRWSACQSPMDRLAKFRPL